MRKKGNNSRQMKYITQKKTGEKRRTHSSNYNNDNDICKIACNFVIINNCPTFKEHPGEGRQEEKVQ